MALEVSKPEAILCKMVTLFCSLAVPLCRLIGRRRNPLAFGVSNPKIILGARVSLLRSLAVPIHSLRVILSNALTVEEG